MFVYLFIDQFRKAELSVYNNNWSKVYDFTPVAGEENFTFMTQVGVLDCK